MRYTWPGSVARTDSRPRPLLAISRGLIGIFAIICGAGTAKAADAPKAIQHPVVACQALAGLHLPDVDIDETAEQAAGAVGVRQFAGPPLAIAVPAHCLVRGVIEKRIGVGGKPYGIRFEMRLPLDWNGRFLFEGGGGINGRVSPALGLVKGPPALQRGFAVITQDAGHEGGDAGFGEDQQARIDMIYRSYERVTVIGKDLVRAYYGKGPDHAYFMGCSEGGREALLVSQRMPLAYDGVVAGNPGFLLGVSFNANADHETLAAIAPKGPDGKPNFTGLFSDADVQLVADTIIKECDGLDGLQDGLIDNPTQCRPDLEKLICRTGHDTGPCLSRVQVGVLRKIYDGGQPSGDHYVTAGYFYDTSISSPIWRGKLAGRLATGGGPGVDSVQGLFLTPYDPGFDDSAIDFAKDAPRLREVGSLNRADGVMYSSFSQHGAKLLVYDGLGDPAFSARELIAWYNRLGQANGGAAATAQFARLFLVAGMTHCGGGQALDDFDPLAASVDWAEHGKVPDQLIAVGRAFPGRSRPLCAFPKEARYKGTGSIEAAANFDCQPGGAAK